MVTLTPHMLLRAYALGVFPMAEGRHDPHVYWIDPEMRGILPLDHIHISRSLRKTLRRNPFEIRCDSDFDGIIEGCAAPGPGRADTWINQQIHQLNRQLFEMGFAHTVECWQDGEMVGGLYGISIGGAFFGESMFSRATDASKVALVHLVARLVAGGYRLLDTQFITDHLAQFGAIEVPRRSYRRMLTAALGVRADFPVIFPLERVAGYLQSLTQTS